MEINYFKILLFCAFFGAFISSLLCYKKTENTPQKYWVYYLGYVVVNELLAFIVAKNDFGFKNSIFYNVYILVSLSFYFYWFYSILDRKRIVLLLSAGFMICVLYCVIYNPIFTQICDIPLVYGAISILILSALYYASLLNKNEVVNFLNLQQFWLVTGLLIFYIGYLPMHAFQDQIENADISYAIPLTVLNILCYGCFMISYYVIRNK